MKIAILGWGSLIWDIREFNHHISQWNESNLELPIEFSRISSSRKGALTLVIDPINGVNVKVRYAIAKLPSLEENIQLLQKREGTTLKNIGFVNLIKDEFKSYHPQIAQKIKDWAEKNNFDGVVWTDLKSNYDKKTGKIFEAKEAFEYLKSLPLEVQKDAFNYINNAPQEVQTPLRNIILIPN